MEYIHRRLFFPEPSLVAFSRSSSFDNVAVAITEGYRQRMDNESLIISDIVYREVL
jgi:putative Mn2+ efflux pump MntP